MAFPFLDFLNSRRNDMMGSPDASAPSQPAPQGASENPYIAYLRQIMSQGVQSPFDASKPYGGLISENNPFLPEDNPNMFLPNTGYFGRHPRLTRTLEGMALGAAFTEPSQTAGQGISNVGKMLISMPQQMQNIRMQRLGPALQMEQLAEQRIQNRMAQQAHALNMADTLRKLMKPDFEHSSRGMMQYNPDGSTRIVPGTENPTAAELRFVERKDREKYIAEHPEYFKHLNGQMIEQFRATGQINTATEPNALGGSASKQSLVDRIEHEKNDNLRKLQQMYKYKEGKFINRDPMKATDKLSIDEFRDKQQEIQNEWEYRMEAAGIAVSHQDVSGWWDFPEDGAEPAAPQAAPAQARVPQASPMKPPTVAPRPTGNGNPYPRK